MKLNKLGQCLLGNKLKDMDIMFTITFPTPVIHYKFLFIKIKIRYSCSDFNFFNVHQIFILLYKHFWFMFAILRYMLCITCNL